MPELPEVETIKRTLEAKLKGLFITAVEIFLPKLIRTPVPEEFQSLLAGQTIQRLERQGKYLLFHLSQNLTMIIHLRMTGRLVYSLPGTPLTPHTHAIFHLNNGYQLRFSDTRQFGNISLVPADNLDKVSGLNSLGKEPLSQEFTREYLKKQLRRHRAALKPLLLNQSFIAGLGNIYADEVLFRARIHPRRLSNTLTPREATRLFHAIQDILKEGIENRGATFRDYVDGNGTAGNYQNLLKVYNREGKPCPKCSKTIVKLRIGGRGTYFCPYCQKM
ncbi:MAG TPA: formamidopyrimidine-DNA glycosylase [Desulfotomaculum sp.]|jgi:formamidopyrimidine-DNA glycosylase|nr:formamidopyrimidine-DNA glycosylase [Desulfotomaculum sp.]